MKNRSVSMEYFAAIQDDASYVEAVLGKVGEFREFLSERGLSDLYERKLSNYYGVSQDGYSSNRALGGGTEGELTNIKINDLRKLVQDQLVIVTSTRPAGIAKAINADVASIKNARLGTAIAEYYMSQAGFEMKFVNLAEIALIVDEGFCDLAWDKDAGDPIRPDIDPETGEPIEGQTIMSGDAKLRIHCPYNVARDYDQVPEKQKWYIISILENRYDLAARYPKFKNEILLAGQDDVPQLKLQEKKGEDNVYTHLVVHDRTPAVPNGRYSLIVGSTLLADMDLPYPEFPVERLTPADVIDGSTGYCQSNDVMAAETITDALHSTIATNNVTFGGQSIVGPPLTGVQVTEIAKGLRYFEVSPELVDKITPLQLTRSAPETFSYIQQLDAKKQSQLGNVQGTLQAQATQGASGASMALIQAQAIQYNSGMQRAYFNVLSKIMTKLIRVLQVYADTPRVARIVGKVKAQNLKEFKYTGEDLTSISTIVYEMVNPVLQTLGGKLDLATTWVQQGLISSPKQMLSFIESGNLDALTLPDEERQLLILEENEWLSEGKPVQAIITENHADHIKGHDSVLASPQAKSDPAVLEATLAHIQEHLTIWQDASINNPAILLATGQQPLPPPPQPMMPPPGALPPGAEAPPMPPEMAGGPNAPMEANQPNMPNLPTNPATGEEAQVPGVTI